MEVKTKKQVNEEITRARIDRLYHKKQMEYFEMIITTLIIHKKTLKK